MDSEIQIALAKAIPQKPISSVSSGEKVGNVKYDAGAVIYRCPRCHRVITPGTKYCWDCGQAILWEEGK